MQSKTPRRQAFKKAITLPSHGFSSPKTWPGGKITVYPWDSDIDEFLIEQSRKTTRQQLVYGLLGKLCDLNGAKVDDFVADEVQIILLVARALSTEGIVTYTSECPACGAKSQEKVKVPDDLQVVGEKKDDYPGYDDVPLPICKDVIRLRPLLVKDEQLIEGRTPDQKTKVSDARLRTMLPIVTINDSKADSLDELLEYMNVLHPTDLKTLESKEKELSPHLNANFRHKCADCGKLFDHALSFDQDFFR